MQLKFIVICLLVLFLFGCTEMTPQEKNVCYSMTSRSYDFIPSCETEESCYSKIDPLFETNLGYEQETNLYELKNSLARSWFYYNRGVKEIKSISKLCQQGDASAIAGQINQARFYLDQSFIELDNVLKQSFEIVTIEEQILTDQKIDLLKEEELFYSLTKLRQILSELDSGQTNSESYVSYYLARVERFNNSNAFNFKPIIEKEPVWLSNYKLIEGTILEKLGISKQGQFPMIYNGLKNAVSYYEFLFYKEQSLAALQNFPTYEFMLLYSELAGNKNSSINRFANLINNTSKNFEIITKNNPILWKDAETLVNETTTILNTTKRSEDVIFLEKELLSGKIETDNQITLLFAQTKEDFFNLKNLKSKNQLRLGEETIKLKEIINKLKQIKQELNEKSNTNIEKINSLCNTHAKEIKNSKYNIENAGLEKIKNDLLFFASKTISEAEDFYYCRKMIETEKDFLEGIQDFEKLKNKKIDLTKDCFNYLDKIFEFIELYELKMQFEELKNREVDSENIIYFQEYCESIKKQVEIELSEDTMLKQIETNFINLHNLLDTLEKINLISNNKEIEKKKEEIEKKLSSWKKYYSGKMIFEAILPIKQDLLEITTTYLKETQAWLENKKIEIIQATITSEIISNSIIRSGEDSNVLLRAIILNPFEQINETSSFEIPSGDALLKKDPWVRQIILDSPKRAILDFVPSGATIIDFAKNIKTKLIEKDSVVYASNEESLIKRKLLLEEDIEINNLLITTRPPYKTHKVIITLDGTETANSFGKEVNFVVKNFSNKNNLFCFFYSNGLLEDNLNLTKTQTNGLGKIITYSFFVKNNLEDEIQNATLIIPLYVGNATKAKVYDELQINKKSEIIDNKIVLKNQAFLEKQERQFEIILTIENTEEYYFSVLEELKNKIIILGGHPIVNTINTLLESPFSIESIKDYEKIIKEASEVLKELEEKASQQTQNALLLEEIEKKIHELKAKLEQMKVLGLIEQSEQIEKLLAEIESLRGREDFIQQAMLLLEKNTFEIDEELIKKLNELWEEINKSEIKDSLKDEIKELFDLKEQIEKIIGSDPLNAQELYNQFNLKFGLLKEKETMLLKEIEENKIKANDEFGLLLKESYSILAILKAELNVDSSLFFKINFVPPITQSRLNKIEFILEEITEKGITESITLKEIHAELKSALENIKRQTIKEFNSLVETQPYSQNLKKAKEFIDSNNFVAAMFVLNEETQDNLWFLGIIPLLVLGGALIIIKKNFSKNQKVKNNQKERVLEQWKD